jgi:hypothetical protein
MVQCQLGRNFWFFCCAHRAHGDMLAGAFHTDWCW